MSLKKRRIYISIIYLWAIVLFITTFFSIHKIIVDGEMNEITEEVENITNYTKTMLNIENIQIISEQNHKNNEYNTEIVKLRNAYKIFNDRIDSIYVMIPIDENHVKIILDSNESFGKILDISQ